ncbi:hypothetical protein GCM10017559_60270 [Streptosporangium longisporum]|uniref:Uncharacterized protein n=1 Tax=Streptosporangium longisporum TaxID=46187 RepID=A0ABN3YDF9_9ACTN
MIVSPACVEAVGKAVFSRAMAGAAMTVIVAADGSEVTAGPVGGVPVAVAVLTMVPALMSAWVVT